MNDKKISLKSKKTLLQVATMNKATKEKFTYKITRNGTIIFDFGKTQKIIDTGREITFTQNAKNLALDYANARFGKKIQKILSS